MDKKERKPRTILDSTIQLVLATVFFMCVSLALIMIVFGFPVKECTHYYVDGAVNYEDLDKATTEQVRAYVDYKVCNAVTWSDVKMDYVLYGATDESDRFNLVQRGQEINDHTFELECKCDEYTFAFKRR